MSAEPGGQSCWRLSLDLALRKRPVETETSPTETLQRRLNALDLTLIGVGASVGAGIFVITGVAAVPTGPAVCFSFLLAGISSIFSALCYAELSARIPVSGSVYLYAFVAFGEFVAVLIGLNVLVDYHVGAAVNVASCAMYLRNTLLLMFPHIWLPSSEVISIVLVLLLTCILSFGVENSLKRVNGLLVFGKVGIVLLVIIVGCTKVETSNLSPMFPYGVGPVLSMSATCSFSYIGFGTVTNAAEECIDPHRDLPIGITVSLLICALLYIAFSIVLVGIIPYYEINPEAPAEDAFGPHYANIPWALMLVNWGAVIGLFTTLLTGLYSQARIYLAMARDDLFFHLFEHVSPTLGTPIYAQWLCGIIAAVLACVEVQKLALFLSIGVLLSYTVVCAGVLVLRSDDPPKAASWSAVVTLFAVAASLASSYISWENYAAMVATIIFTLLAFGCWSPFYRFNYSRPTTFACPGCPSIPLLGLTINGYLLSQCHWQAWLRLALTSLIILGAYALRVRDAMKTRGRERQLHLSLAMQTDTCGS